MNRVGSGDVILTNGKEAGRVKVTEKTRKGDKDRSGSRYQGYNEGHRPTIYMKNTTTGGKEDGR